MFRAVVRSVALSVVLAGPIDAQDSVQHRACRDAHPRPVCGSYFLFEFNGAGRLAGTSVSLPRRSSPPLGSWFAWDAGWMQNPSPRYSRGFAAEVGGNSDGVRVALRAKVRRWLAEDYVVDGSAGPLMANFQTGDGLLPTYGLTGDVGLGRARMLLVTLGADMAKQNGAMQFALHAGGRTESRGVAVVSALAAIGGLIVVNGLRQVTY